MKALILLLGFLTLNSFVAKSQNGKTEKVLLTTSVVIVSPGKEDKEFNKKKSYEFLATWGNKEFNTVLNVDSISIEKSIIKLHALADNLIIVLNKENMKQISDKIGGSILNKTIGVTGMLVPYNKKFAINIKTLDQLRLPH